MPLIDEAEESTRHNATITLTVAVNYGGRQEIVDSVRRIAEQVRDGGSRRGRDFRGGRSSDTSRPAICRISIW